LNLSLPDVSISWYAVKYIIRNTAKKRGAVRIMQEKGKGLGKG